MAHGLSKSRLLAHRQCPRRLWLQIYRPDLIEEDAGMSARFAVGHRVGEIAQDLQPDGVLIDPDNLREALLETKRLMADSPRPLFEATFSVDKVLVRADLLIPAGEGRWRMAEVKSSASVKSYHLTDAAVQSWVLEKSGVTLDSIEIAHIDTRFVYPGEGDYRGLLHYEPVDDEIRPMISEVPTWVAEAQATLEGPDPETPPGDHCHDPFDCPFLSHCVPSEPEEAYPVEILPYGKKLAAELRAEGYSDLRQVPANRLTKPLHIRVWRATKDGKAILDAAAKAWVDALVYPRYYIDFETIQFAVPIWAGTRPYQQVPFQWSCHIEYKTGELDHEAYLANDSKDPRYTFARTLLDTVGDFGPIVVYNAAFERTRLLELADSFPDLSPALVAVTDRMVDLLPIAREHYYHPDMRGSWSIKAVLPTIAPELAYDELEVGDGGMAQEAYLEMTSPDTTPERKVVLYAALLEYCERDTLAMVRVARYFQGGR